MAHNVFKGNMHKYVLTDIHVASRYKVVRPLRTKKSNEVALELKAIYKKGDMFKYPKVFQCDNSSEFESEVRKLLEKHSIEIRRATTKYRHTHKAFVKNFNKELAKLLFKLMDAQELQDPLKVSTIWISMIGMKPKDAIKLDTVPLDKKYPEETVLPKDELYRYLYEPGEQHGDQKRRAIDVIWSKNMY